MYYVYILRTDNRYYVWYTNNIERRLREHKRGKTYTTRRYKEIEMVWYWEYEEKKEAMEMERRIKRSGKISYRIWKEWYKKW